MKNKKLILSIILLVVVIALAIALIWGYIAKLTYKPKRPIVTMEIEGYGTVKMELYPEMAPNTVKNFIKLANEGHFNGIKFTRVEDYLIQSASKELGEGEVAYSIKGEFKENGFEDNTLKYERGTVGIGLKDFSDYYYTYYYYTGNIDGIMEQERNSGYDVFFIMTQDMEDFDGRYTAFGKVTEGMDIVDKITELETTKQTDEETGEEVVTSMPVNPPVIKSLTVDTQGVKYEEPVRQEAFDMMKWFSNLLTVTQY